jgi:hypothetical protein
MAFDMYALTHPVLQPFGFRHAGPHECAVRELPSRHLLSRGQGRHHLVNLGHSHAGGEHCLASQPAHPQPPGYLYRGSLV